ncbi:MAG: hypothetical protein KGH97_04085, partial [Patescibacteria group bacterium]|nr:hypothetical protein [Patescibacteria group bacterium]
KKVFVQIQEPYRGLIIFRARRTIMGDEYDEEKSDELPETGPGPLDDEDMDPVEKQNIEAEGDDYGFQTRNADGELEEETF